MSSCERYEALANLALDEEATLEEIAELNRHMENCPNCRAYYEDIKRIHGIFAPQRAVLPEDFSARVMARVRETAQDPIVPEEEKVIRFPHWKRWTALAACCTLAVLSLWAFRWTGGVKDGMVSTDDAAPQMADARSVAQEPEGQSPAEELMEDEEAPVSDEAAPAKYEEDAKSAAAGSSSESADLPPEDADADADAIGGTPSGSHRENGSQPDEADPASNIGELDQADAPAGDAPSEKAETAPADETAPAEEPVAAPAEPAPVPEPAEPEGSGNDVDPVEIVNAPEPGILIAFGGGAAQNWVEQVLGLEWAAGGSYSLSAEQYVQLLALLDAAGDPYEIEPNEGYCLMTE